MNIIIVSIVYDSIQTGKTIIIKSLPKRLSDI